MNRQRKSKPPTMMDRARAARAIVNARGFDGEAIALAGFMAIFHPEVKQETVRELVRDMRDRRAR